LEAGKATENELIISVNVQGEHQKLWKNSRSKEALQPKALPARRWEGGWGVETQQTAKRKVVPVIKTKLREFELRKTLITRASVR